MTNLAENTLFYGGNQAPPRETVVRSGPVTARLEEGTLRYVRLGRHEVLRQVYAAVRDHNWETVAARVSDVEVDAGDDSFIITFTSHHERDDVDFTWDGRITGSADGTIVFSFDGRANSTFRRNRIGFCVLHPMECAGAPCTVEHVDGATTHGEFPERISPHQPFRGMRAITHQIAPGVNARVVMEGDTFEMEDQRNWTDASYKIYCTPLEDPFPVTVYAGERVQQRVTITLEGDLSQAATGEDGTTLRFEVGTEMHALPHIGLGMASRGGRFTATEVARLRALNLSHLRTYLRLSQPDWKTSLEQAIRKTHAVGCALELALFVSDDASDELGAAGRELAKLDRAPARILIFHEEEKSTRAQWVRLARQRLAGVNAPIGGGTDAFFTELNRERPPVDDLDFVCYSLNPQVHAFDNTSLAETLAGQAETVKTAQSFSGGRPIVVGPVTLRMRWNPNATGPPAPVPPNEPPPQVDPRQMSLFGAGWTLGSIKHLATNGTRSLTYFETTGWRGVMATACGSPLPSRFHDIPGGVYPMYAVFLALAPFVEGGQIVASRSNSYVTVEGIVMRRGGHTRVLLANLTAKPHEIQLCGLSGEFSVRRLDADTAETFMKDPAAWNAQEAFALQPDGTAVSLEPYSLVWFDQDTES
jgi:hypothetical protein